MQYFSKPDKQLKLMIDLGDHKLFKDEDDEWYVELRIFSGEVFYKYPTELEYKLARLVLELKKGTNHGPLSPLFLGTW